MKKTSSLVWRFFDRLEENKRCVAVLCKLCDTQYKYFGNTTNLRTHLVNKHPIQWELLQNGTLDESTFRTFDDDENTNQSVAPKRRKYLKVDVLEHSETDIDNNDEVDTTMNEHERQNSDEEWLEDEWIETYEPKQNKVKYRRVKREVTTPTSPKSVRSYAFNRKPSTYKPNTHPRLNTVTTEVRKDEYAVFGEYIGNKLRKFKSYQTSVNVQQLITTILWQAEYGVYDNIESVKRIVLSTVQEMDTTHSSSAKNENIQISTEGIMIDKDPDNIVQSVIDSVRVVEG
ncbi:PREDICTED: uncharacterized protein LOC106121907 [Papilio xuthus]|uniref:Uncharacterized protein LOC106121907 n=1 Tax=Papilio xuthus TaxID=66420 RepID=A0A0N1PFY1_PAPXU|nr:PREDICTED: uncharacterized protein LOC106121907 [Papilio xuthus]KPJ01291.1 hypothetical protein RR46_01426 [Papilio xuthus]